MKILLTHAYFLEEDEKEKEGKKKMRQIGSIDVPQKAFLDVLKLDE